MSLFDQKTREALGNVEQRAILPAVAKHPALAKRKYDLVTLDDCLEYLAAVVNCEVFETRITRTKFGERFEDNAPASIAIRMRAVEQIMLARGFLQDKGPTQVSVSNSQTTYILRDNSRAAPEAEYVEAVMSLESDNDVGDTAGQPTDL